MKKGFQKYNMNKNKMIRSLSGDTIEKIKIYSTRVILSVLITGLFVSSGQTVLANSIKAPQNVSRKTTYANKDQNNSILDSSLGLDISDEYVAKNFKSINEPNYAEDEEKIKNFSGSERYRSTQMEQGNGPAFSISGPEMDFIDGFRYNTLEPSASSPDQTLWGLEFEFDKEKGQRTYTDFYFTNTGGFGRPTLLEAGKISANDVGDKLSDKGDFKDPTYKAKAEIDIFASNVNRNLNLYSTKEDIEHINNINNKNTIIAWKGNYTRNNPNGSKATQGSSSEFGFTVNPWPNENDKLSVIKLNGSHDKKEYVHGQTITTDVSVENLDANARERLVGQVYHPITGEIVPDAKAYINDQDKVVIEMPKGAIDENGKINKDSIFYNNPKYNALQNLEVKFFARPRTEEEFRAIGIEANYGEDNYSSTGAGTETIKHKGKDVVIDKQGIDRYDHYNLVGRFMLNLDDTRYYDQGFIDGNNDDTSKHTSSKVKPGEDLEVKLYVPEDKKDKDVFPNQKTPEEMETAKDENQAVGSIDWQFIDKINEGKEEKDKWKLVYDENTLPTTFKITPPASAKAGDFVAVPLTYTYTNGSTDVHWFHFVVQDSTNNRPEYFVQVEYPSEEQTSVPKLSEDPDNKKLKPLSYSILEGTEFKDDKGNEWNVTIDKNTGVVTAKPKNPDKFDGGEKLQVPVVAHYNDPSDPEKDIIEETKAEFVIKEKYNLDARYNAVAGKSGDKLSSDIIIDQKDEYNRKPTKFTLDSDTFVDNKGNIWNVTIDENTGKVTATVPNAEDDKTIDGALLNVPVTTHYYEAGNDNEIASKKVEVQFIASGTDGTITHTEEIPFDYDVKYDPDFYNKYPDATENYKKVKEGKAGKKTTTWIIKDSKIVGKPGVVVNQEPENALILVGQKDFKGDFTSKETNAIQFKIRYIVDETLESGKVVVDEEGSLGEEEVTVTHTIENGKVVKSEKGKPVIIKDPVDRIVRIGTKPTKGSFTYESEKAYEVIIRENPNLDSGKHNVIQKGIVGKTETIVKIENSKEISRKPITIEEKQDMIIEIGTKNICEMPTEEPTNANDPTKPSTSGSENPKTTKKKAKSHKNSNPNTGVEVSKAIFAFIVGLIGSPLLSIVFKRNKNE